MEFMEFWCGLKVLEFKAFWLEKLCKPYIYSTGEHIVTFVQYKFEICQRNAIFFSSQYGSVFFLQNVIFGFHKVLKQNL